MGFLRALRNGEDDDVDSLGEVAELIGINMYTVNTGYPLGGFHCEHFWLDWKLAVLLAPLHLACAGLSWHMDILDPKTTSKRLTWVFLLDVLDVCTSQVLQSQFFANHHFVTHHLMEAVKFLFSIAILGPGGMHVILVGKARSSWSWARNVGIHKVGQQTIGQKVVMSDPKIHGDPTSGHPQNKKNHVSFFMFIWSSSVMLGYY